MARRRKSTPRSAEAGVRGTSTLDAKPTPTFDWDQLDKVLGDRRNRMAIVAKPPNSFTTREYVERENAIGHMIGMTAAERRLWELCKEGVLERAGYIMVYNVSSRRSHRHVCYRVKGGGDGSHR